MTTLELSKNVKLIRKAKGMTQKEIAERLFINERTYSKFERGEKKSIDFRFLSAIAKVLQTDLPTLTKTEEALTTELNTPLNNSELISNLAQQTQQGMTEIMHQLREMEQTMDRISASVDRMSSGNVLPML